MLDDKINEKNTKKYNILLYIYTNTKSITIALVIKI